RDHTERLADRIDVDAGRRLLRVLRLEQRRKAAAKLDDFEPARDLAERIREDLAVLGGKDARDFLAALVHELADAEEDLGAPRERHLAPGRECRARRLHRAVDLLGRREV